MNYGKVSSYRWKILESLELFSWDLWPLCKSMNRTPARLTHDPTDSAAFF